MDATKVLAALLSVLLQRLSSAKHFSAEATAEVARPASPLEVPGLHGWMPALLLVWGLLWLHDHECASSYTYFEVSYAINAGMTLLLRYTLAKRQCFHLIVIFPYLFIFIITQNTFTRLRY